jgi:hypothetical protein
MRNLNESESRDEFKQRQCAEFCKQAENSENVRVEGENVTEDFSMYIPKAHFEQIPIKDLISQHRYQQNVSKSIVRCLADNFDIYQINPVKVIRQNGANYVFDGPHTIEAVATVSGSRDTPVWCMIYEDLHCMEEVNLFATPYRPVKPILPIDIFKAKIEAGNSDALAVKAMVETYGLQISGSKKPGAICAVSTLCQIYKQHGSHVLNRVLSLCTGAWSGDMNSLCRNILRGIAHLVTAYGDNLCDGLFKERVGAVSVKEIVRTAKERRSDSIGFAEAILTVYNDGTEYPLPPANLKRKSDKNKDRVTE